jgi:cell division protease FtsH
VLGPHRNWKPDYDVVNIAPGRNVNLLTCGRMLLKHGETRLAVRIRFSRHGEKAWMAVEGLTTARKEIQQFAAEIDRSVRRLALYKGQKLKYDGSLEFLKPSTRGWGDLCLAPEVKDELVSNTVGFLKRSRQLARYGIPRKRGLILAGMPGTGKTLVSKVLMGDSPGITCLSTDPALLTHPRYIRELYEIAGDLKPTIVFLEDIDLIGGDRCETHNSCGNALNELLDILDGVKEHSEVVTVATTNFAESLDDALSQRPSRFDRIITMRPPDRVLRREIVHNLSRRIPLDTTVQEHIVRMTEGYTPAQVQEVVYGLVIQQGGHCRGRKSLSFTVEEVNTVLRRINHRNSDPIGFRPKDIYTTSGDGGISYPR